MQKFELCGENMRMEVHVNVGSAAGQKCDLIMASTSKWLEREKRHFNVKMLLCRLELLYSLRTFCRVKCV